MCGADSTHSGAMTSCRYAINNVYMAQHRECKLMYTCVEIQACMQLVHGWISCWVLVAQFTSHSQSRIQELASQSRSWLYPRFRFNRSQLLRFPISHENNSHAPFDTQYRPHTQSTRPCSKQHAHTVQNRRLLQTRTFMFDALLERHGHNASSYSEAPSQSSPKYSGDSLLTQRGRYSLISSYTTSSAFRLSHASPQVRMLILLKFLSSSTKSVTTFSFHSKPAVPTMDTVLWFSFLGPSSWDHAISHFFCTRFYTSHISQPVHSRMISPPDSTLQSSWRDCVPCHLLSFKPKWQYYL